MPRDPRAEAHRARQRAMRESMRPGPPDALADAYDELHSALADAMRFEAAQGPLIPVSDATELSGADTDRPDPGFGGGTGDTLGGLLGDMGFTRADIDAIARDVIAEHRETVELYRESMVFLNDELETPDLNHVTLGEILARHEFPDGTWDVRITAVRRGE